MRTMDTVAMVNTMDVDGFWYEGMKLKLFACEFLVRTFNLILFIEIKSISI